MAALRELPGQITVGGSRSPDLLRKRNGRQEMMLQFGLVQNCHAEALIVSLSWRKAECASDSDVPTFMPAPSAAAIHQT
jgi:hypothetical protein